jgi:hypothetical protein
MTAMPRFHCACGHEWSADYAISCPLDEEGDPVTHRIKLLNYLELCGSAAECHPHSMKKEP